MIRWGNIEFLYLVLLVPVVGIFLHYLKGKQGRRELQNFTSTTMLLVIAPQLSIGRKKFKDFLLLWALAFMLIAAADPQIGTRIEEIKREGIDLVVAVDVSHSMLAEDIAPSRLAKAKHEMSNLLDRLEGDRVALVAFAGQAVVECPLTMDYGAAELFLDVLNPGMVSKTGTSLAAAIRISMQAFQEDSQAGKAIVLITDGEDHEAAVMDAVREAKDMGVVIHAVGIGSVQGVPIPISEAGGEYKKDNRGNVIVTRLDEELLQKIASETGGIYQRCSTGGDDLDAILNAVAGLEKGELGSHEFTQYEHRYQIFVALALLALVLEYLISDRRRKLPPLLRFLSSEGASK
ncbi:VWA domain-containing protein [bacterium]|nr:VWA domain-containing protein [bacterium]MBU1652737.1 VWA domain-containing protein [bacterium]MBU1882491.1 VWA domain-containing protein [bacterium]